MFTLSLISRMDLSNLVACHLWQERKPIACKVLYQEGSAAGSSPCDETCGYNKLPCGNCNSYAILQEQNLGGKIEQVWTIIDNANPYEVAKIKEGIRNPLGWPFPIKSTVIGSRIDYLPENQYSENYHNVQVHGVGDDNSSSGASATAPPLSRTASPDSGLYDLSRGKPEPFQQSIASQLSANHQKHIRNQSKKNSGNLLKVMFDQDSVQSAQEALEECIVVSSDENQSQSSSGNDERLVSSGDIRTYIKKNFEDDQKNNLNIKHGSCKRCMKVKQLQNEIGNIVPETELHKECECDENSSDTIGHFKKSRTKPKRKAPLNPFESDEETTENESTSSGKVGGTPSTRPSSTILSAKKLMRNKVGVMVETNKEVKTVYFAPPSENRLGRFSNILAAEAGPDDSDDTHQTSQRTLLLTQLAVGFGVVVLSGALVMFIGAMAKSLMV